MAPARESRDAHRSRGRGLSSDSARALRRAALGRPPRTPCSAPRRPRHRRPPARLPAERPRPVAGRRAGCSAGSVPSPRSLSPARRCGRRARPRARARGGRARTPFPTSRLRRRGTSRAPYEVDRHGYALEAEALAQLVLDPVAIVARDEPRIVDEDAEARRSRVDLRGVEQIQAPTVARRRLAAGTQILERAGQLGGGDAR